MPPRSCCSDCSSSPGSPSSTSSTLCEGPALAWGRSEPAAGLRVGTVLGPCSWGWGALFGTPAAPGCGRGRGQPAGVGPSFLFCERVEFSLQNKQQKRKLRRPWLGGEGSLPAPLGVPGLLPDGPRVGSAPASFLALPGRGGGWGAAGVPGWLLRTPQLPQVAWCARPGGEPRSGRDGLGCQAQSGALGPDPYPAPALGRGLGWVASGQFLEVPREGGAGGLARLWLASPLPGHTRPGSRPVPSPRASRAGAGGCLCAHRGWMPTAPAPSPSLAPQPQEEAPQPGPGPWRVGRGPWLRAGVELRAPRLATPCFLLNLQKGQACVSETAGSMVAVLWWRLC